MARSENSAFFIGRVISDLESLDQIDGVKFFINTHEEWVNKDGENVSKTYTHECVVLQQNVKDSIKNQIKKDCLIYISGKIRVTSEVTEKNTNSDSVTIEVLDFVILKDHEERKSHPSKSLISLIGNLGKDPIIRQGKSGNIAKFPMATSEEKYNKDTQEKISKTNWHQIVIFNQKLSELAEKYLKKGSKVFVKGRLRPSSWTDMNGEARNNVEIEVFDFIILTRANNTNNVSSSSGYSEDMDVPF